MLQNYVSVLLIIALLLPFVGAMIIRLLSRVASPQATIIVAAVTAVVIVSTVLGLANINIGSLRIANLTLLLPVAPSVDRGADVSSDVIDAELNSEEGTPTTIPEVTPTPIPTLQPTSVVSNTNTLTNTTSLTDTTTLTDTTALTDTTTLTDTTALTDTTTLTNTTTLATPTPAATSAPTATAAPAATRTYTVQAGDSLQGIAAQFNVSVKQILNANPELQSPDNVIVGQELKIP